MQFTIASIAALVAIAQAENIAVVLNNDIKSHLNDYMSVVQAQSGDAAEGLLSLYAAGQTYTDDSYTTLVASAEYASLSAFASQLPWYSERLESQLTAGAEAVVSSSSSEAASSTSSAAESSSSVATTTAAASSSAVESASASASKSVESSHSTAGANALVPGALAGALIGAFALL